MTPTPRRRPTVIKSCRYIVMAALGLCAVIAGSTVRAQAPGADQELGRLFTTPEERRRLDELRRQTAVTAPENEAPQLETAAARAMPGPLTLNGLVYRSDGRSTAWLNGNHIYLGEAATQTMSIDKINVGHDAVTISVPGINSELRLKAGQTYEPESGRLIELVPGDYGFSARDD